MKVKRALAAAAVWTTGLVLTACGGGGGDSSAVGDTGSTLTGTALTGAALVGANVTVIDSTGMACATATTGSDGKWSASLGKCGSAPYLIKATGKDSSNMDVTFYSAATSADVNGNVRVNVSQLTDAIVKVALNTDTPESNQVTDLTVNKLQEASKQILSNLVPADVLSASGLTEQTDIRITNVTAGSHAGLDKLHDRVSGTKVFKENAGISVLARVGGFGNSGNHSTVVGASVSSDGQLTPKAGEIGGVVVVKKENATTAEIQKLSDTEQIKPEMALMLANWDSVYANAVPATWESALSFDDACYLNDGYTKSINIEEWKSNGINVRSSQAYRVGAKRSNLKILSVNPSADNQYTTAKVSYDIAYTNGTIKKNSINYMVKGNSAALCTNNGISESNGQTGDGWRFIGNARQVQANIGAAHELYVSGNLADGLPSKYKGSISSSIEFYLKDPGNKGITYAIVKGPLLPSSGLKFLMNSILVKEAQGLLNGKRGTYLSHTRNGYIEAENRFNASMCFYVDVYRAWDADKADCLKYGASGNGWYGNDYYLSDDQIQSLDNDKTYTIAFYADDGWKTVNGQSGKTAIYTYKSTLNERPFTSKEISESNFPKITPVDMVGGWSDFVSKSKNSGGPFAMNLAPAVTPATPADANIFGYAELWQYSQGSAATNVSDATYPHIRQEAIAYPSGKESISNFNVTLFGLPQGLNKISYVEAGIESRDENGRYLRTFYGFGSDVEITQSPINQSAAPGRTATFSVSATGIGTLTYQWKKNGINIPGATSSSYTTPALVATDNNSIYSVAVSNEGGRVTSKGATLSVSAGGGGVAGNFGGTYSCTVSGDDTGTINLIVPSPYGAISSCTGYSGLAGNFTCSGFVSSVGVISGTNSAGASVSGTISNNGASGSWSNVGTAGTFSCTRS